MRKNICKHIAFIIARIAQLPDIARKVMAKEHIDQNDYLLIFKSVKERLTLSETKEENNKIISQTDENCFICFESLENEEMV